MIALLTKIVLALARIDEPTALEADALRETAPNDLSPIEATEHLAAARVAARMYDVDEADLLAIAHHESRYVPDVVTHERDKKTGRWIGDSCGVMTPYDHPRTRCPPETLTVLGGYLHGAEHLAVWKRTCRGDRLCALRGYSGNCWDGQTREHVRTWVVFDRRAERIRRAVRAARTWTDS